MSNAEKINMESLNSGSKPQENTELKEQLLLDMLRKSNPMEWSVLLKKVTEAREMCNPIFSDREWLIIQTCIVMITDSLVNYAQNIRDKKDTGI